MMAPRRIAADVGFAEGPVHRRSGDIVFVSIDRGHLSSVDGEGTSLLAAVGGEPNGAAEGADGSIFLAMAGGGFVGGRRTGVPGGVLAIRPDGLHEWITRDPVSPNDLCFGPDGLLYVTDPTRGVRTDGRLWRVNVETGLAQLLASVPWYPNGIGFGRGDDTIYVADTASSRIARFPCGEDGLGVGVTAVQMEHGRPDGFAFDADNNILVAALPDAGSDGPGDIQIWSEAGELLDVFEPGPSRHYTNVALSVDRRLAITDGGDIAAVRAGHESGGVVLLVEDWPAMGLPLHPFR